MLLIWLIEALQLCRPTAYQNDCPDAGKLTTPSPLLAVDRMLRKLSTRTVLILESAEASIKRRNALLEMKLYVPKKEHAQKFTQDR
jgi:hypothetical protein